MFVAFIPAAFAQADGLGRQDSLISMVMGSGPVVQAVLYILILFSVFSWGIIFYKLRQIRVARSQSARFTEIFWDTKNLTTIHSARQQLKQSPVAHVFRAGYQELVRMTRPTEEASLPFVKEYISWGAGPRASQYLVLGAKARAALDGRPMADEDDLRSVASTVLTHRIVINFAAEAAGRTAADIVEQLIKEARWQPT